MEKASQFHNLKTAFNILRHSKLVWGFSFLSVLCSFLYSSVEFIHIYRSFLANLLNILLFLAMSIVFAAANGSLVYSVHQIALKQNPSYPVAWKKGKSKTFQILGMLFLWLTIPLLGGIFSILITSNITNKAITLPLLWLLALIANAFYSPVMIFGISAIMIDGLKALAAIRTGFLITIKNFFTVLVIATVVWVIQILVDGLLLESIALGIIQTDAVIPSLSTFDYASYRSMLTIPIIAVANTLITLLVMPWIKTYFTLEYLKYTDKATYPELIHKKV